MEHVVRTIYGNQLQSALLLGLPYTAPPFTTLNEKLGIQAGVTLAPGKTPVGQYFAIGNGGHSATVGADGIPLMTIAQHKATDAGLFNQIPFVLKEIGDDLQPSERIKYALRKELVIGGVTYIAYYLRRISMVSVGTKLEYRNINADVITTTDFIPTAANLSPSKTAASSTGVNALSGDYVTCVSKLPITFTDTEIQYLMDACMILFGDINYAIISEIALCSGSDKTVNILASTGNFNFNEAIQVQVVTFISSMHIARYCTSGLEKILDVGSNSPLYNIV
jgi:hypothetical protein